MSHSAMDTATPLSHRDFLVNKLSGGAFRIEHRVTVDSPPSIVLEGLKRYFAMHGNVLSLNIPVKNPQGSGPEFIDRPVVVEYEAHPNKSLIGRHDDRLEFRWRPRAGDKTAFIGRFTILPLSGKSELVLKGRYQPSVEHTDEALGIRFDPNVVQAISLVLVNDIKTALESDFQTLNENEPEALRRGEPLGRRSALKSLLGKASTLLR